MKRNSLLTNSTLRALDVLEYLASHSDGIGVTDISRGLGLDKSTTYRILNTLKFREYVVQDKTTKKFRLGLKILELSYKVSAQMELKIAAAPVLSRLVKMYNETVHLGVLDRGEVLYVDTKECSQFMRITSHIGLRNPVHCTALGKVLLAFLPEEKVEQICKEKGMKRFTKNTITSVDELKKELNKIRHLGYAVDNRELYESTRCIAAPVRNHEGKVVGAISISAPADRLTLNEIKKVGKSMAAMAEEISHSLGYRKDSLS